MKNLALFVLCTATLIASEGGKGHENDDGPEICEVPEAGSMIPAIAGLAFVSVLIWRRKQ